jgi:signal recognition particle subunit SRP54
MEEMKSISDGKSQEELMENMSKGKFTLRDMYKQFQQVMKIGPLNKVMGMIPGMPEYLIPNGDDESTNRLKKFMYMMDSMNAAELDGKIDLHAKGDPNVEKRIRRIAAGSGTHPTEVKMLLQTHKQFEGVVNKMGKSGMMGKGGARQKQMMEQMRKNPNAMMKQLQNNPQAMKMVCKCMSVILCCDRMQLICHVLRNQMQQMMGGGGMGGGGMPNMAQMMAAMGGGMGMHPGGAGGMPDMATMQQMMGQMGAGGGGGMPDMVRFLALSRFTFETTLTTAVIATTLIRIK